ncbi:MAG: hypothetical protein QX196_01535 [Methylococcaceae bacterium]
MPTINTKYIVYNHAGTGVRHHHFSDQNTIKKFAPEPFTPPGKRNADFPVLYNYNNEDLPFAFTSIHGAADGNHLYLSPDDNQYPVGESDIEVLVIYAPPPGVGEGIWVDAFNVDAGNFSDDLNFIQILTPPTPPDSLDSLKTGVANQEGSVFPDHPEHIRASEKIDGGVPFVSWKQIVPPQQIVKSRDFELKQDQSGEIWFAFYQSPPAVTEPDRSWVLPGSWVLAVFFIMLGALIWIAGHWYCTVCTPWLLDWASVISVAIGIGILSINKVLPAIQQRYNSHIGRSSRAGQNKTTQA